MPNSSHLRFLFVGFLLLAFYSRPAHSQEPPCQIRKLPVSFRDAHNLPIQNISVADLEAKVQGKPVKFLSLSPDPRPHRIVLLLDSSGSMNGIAGEPSPWGLAVSLARHFFEVNRQRSQIALLFFNDQVNEVIDFSQGNSAVSDKLQLIANDGDYVKKNVKGTTVLRDAMLEGMQLLDHPTSADALYVLSDGEDNESKHRAADVTRRLAVTSVRLFAVLILHHQRTPEEISGPRELSEIAQKSGGDILSAAAWSSGRVALTAAPRQN